MIASHFFHDIRVFDKHGVHVVGHLLAVDDTGLFMVTDVALESGKEILLQLEDVMSMAPGKKVIISGTCGHCELDASVLDMYHVRFNFTDLSLKASRLAHSLH